MSDTLASDYLSRDLFLSPQLGISGRKIASSINLFESLRPAVPIVVDLYAVLGGLPFTPALSSYLNNLYFSIQAVLSDLDHYLVQPGNHAIELLVLKWHTCAQPIAPSVLEAVSCTLQTLFTSPIDICPYRIQINDDGCILFAFLDPSFGFRKLRQSILAAHPTLPSRQSSWVHIPLGRILQAPTKSQFRRIQADFLTLPVYSLPETLTYFSVVHESRWYLEERSLISFVSI